MPLESYAVVKEQSVAAHFRRCIFDKQRRTSMETMESFYTKQTETLGKVFRFFSEMPFSNPNDEILNEPSRPCTSSLIVDQYVRRESTSNVSYYWHRAIQLEDREGYFPQEGCWIPNHYRSNRFWGDPPASMGPKYHVDSAFLERGVFDWSSISQEEILDSKKGRPL